MGASGVLIKCPTARWFVRSGGEGDSPGKREKRAINEKKKKKKKKKKHTKKKKERHEPVTAKMTSTEDPFAWRGCPTVVSSSIA